MHSNHSPFCNNVLILIRIGFIGCTNSISTRVIYLAGLTRVHLFITECKPEPGTAPSSCGSHTLSAPSTEHPQGQASPEPRLMSENLATMSLLSASECHLATLQDEDGDT